MNRNSSWRNLLLLGVLLPPATNLLGQTAATKRIARGKYLVEDAGACQDCHTPRTAQGELDPTKWLQGAVVDFKPIQPIPCWAAVSLPIAGLPGMKDADAFKFPQTGLKPNGKRAGLPMPSYRFSREDAEAIVAYLKSLKPAGK